MYTPVRGCEGVEVNPTQSPQVSHHKRILPPPSTAAAVPIQTKTLRSELKDTHDVAASTRRVYEGTVKQREDWRKVLRQKEKDNAEAAERCGCSSPSQVTPSVYVCMYVCRTAVEVPSWCGLKSVGVRELNGP